MSEKLTWGGVSVFDMPLGTLHNLCNFLIREGHPIPLAEKYILALHLRTKKCHGYQLTVKGMLGRLHPVAKPNIPNGGEYKKRKDCKPTRWRTFDDWADDGYRVVKGSSAKKKGREYLFSNCQVWQPKK